MKYSLLVLLMYCAGYSMPKRTPVYDAVTVRSGDDASTAVWSQSPALQYQESGFQLHAAVINGLYERVRELIAAGWDLNAKSLDGKTPLELAGDGDIKQLLLDSGAR